MYRPVKEIQILLLRLSLALAVYPACKLLFFLFNYNYFSDISFPQFLSILFFGLRFDLSALALMNAPYILLHMIPFFISKKWYQLLLHLVFMLVNSLSILADCVDMEYFKFTQKRTTSDFFDLFGLGNDMSSLLPRYLTDFWYIVFIWIGLTALIAWAYGKIKSSSKQQEKDAKSPLSETVIRITLHTVLIGSLIVAFRGGLQLRPIMPINASEYVAAKNIPLIINTPFSIIKSYGLETLEEKNYFPETELPKIIDPIHRSFKTARDSSRKPNVFIIILESFSKEYIGALSGQHTHTPFLDSLISQGLVFDNAFANGKRSLEGLPAVAAGIPGLINEPYITSIYGSNRFNSIATALGETGYTSAFFHGGTNGTMGFDAFSNAAGYQAYHGRNEYNNEKDYDGNWGIWDEEFFQYTYKTVNEMQEPFLATLFSLSSHHPYRIPERYKSQFKDGELPILKSIEYSDHALKRFFDSAKKEKWFDRTLFVITADHTGPSNDPYYSNSAGIFRVPILVYQHNGKLKGINHRITQHIDIMPTLLDYLEYPGNYFAFGNSMLDSTSSGYAVNFINDVYQYFEEDHLLQFDGSKTIGFYDFKNDSLLQNNLSGKFPEKEKSMEQKLKAIIQTYYHGMIHNKLTAGKK